MDNVSLGMDNLSLSELVNLSTFESDPKPKPKSEPKLDLDIHGSNYHKSVAW